MLVDFSKFHCEDPECLSKSTKQFIIEDTFVVYAKRKENIVAVHCGYCGKELQAE